MGSLAPESAGGAAEKNQDLSLLRLERTDKSTSAGAGIRGWEGTRLLDQVAFALCWDRLASSASPSRHPRQETGMASTLELKLENALLLVFYSSERIS